MCKRVLCLVTCIAMVGSLAGCRSSSVESGEDGGAVARSSASVATDGSASLTDREHAERTMNSMRTIATCLIAFWIDWGHYPTANSLKAVEGDLSPTYVKTLPMEDSWGNPFELSSSKTGYKIRSYGRDGKRDEHPPSGFTDNPDADIVNENARFTQAPYNTDSP